jgi:uncharacterized OB-fold protein
VALDHDTANGDTPPLPITAFLKIPETGSPYLQGSKCQACGEVQVGDRVVCPKCGARDNMQRVKLAETGKLYNYTVVYRNFPGVAVPFVSAIVDLDGGGVLKGNLIDVEPDPSKLAFDMPVRVVIRDAGRKDKAGNSYLAYFFTPAKAA